MLAQDEVIPIETFQKACSFLYRGLRNLLREVNEGADFRHVAKVAAGSTTVVDEAVGAKDIPIELYDSVGRLESRTAEYSVCLTYDIKNTAI
jgi:hypothetical protein